MAHDVFVSYASEDKPVADAVCGTLEANGIRCWIAPRDVLPGVHYGEAIIDVIQDCRIMVLIFSSKANMSGHIPKATKSRAAIQTQNFSTPSPRTCGKNGSKYSIKTE